MLIIIIIYDSQIMPCIYFINTRSNVWEEDPDKSNPDNSKRRDEFCIASTEFIIKFISGDDQQSGTLICNYCDPNILDKV